MKGKATSKNDCRKKALNYISRYTCSSTRLKEYLKRKGCEEHIDEIVKELVENGLLNDFKNAQLLVEIYRRKLGKKAIHHRLLQKGFSREVVDEALSFTDEEELEFAVKEAEKKLASLKDANLKKVREKLYRFLIRRGFSSQNALKAVRKVLKNSNLCEDNGG